MLFSTLVDADWLETERFMKSETQPRGQYAGIESLCQQFNAYLQRFNNPQTELNRRRTETLHACMDQSNQKPGFFTLTVPTGGGKTLASMAFALNHAREHGMKRVIYVIPFTSIIEQNAAVFRNALEPLGSANVLEHHSNFDWEKMRQSDDDESNRIHDKLKLAAENWDIPIVVTTNVQFFESLFANKKSRARKLHNLARSVMVFDEVQMLPREYLKPCVLAIYELVTNYEASAVLSTATQPALHDFFPEGTSFTELAPDPRALFDFYRRVQVINMGQLSDEELLEQLNTHRQVLCIVNTRRHAKGLFDRLSEGSRFHLSTLMCPAHRQERMKEIYTRLNNGQDCRVVSTQVMEAGIDIDFPAGYRAMAGLDSIIQAAGRVNREMKQASGEVFIFHPKTEHIRRTPVFIEQTASVAESTLRDFGEDPVTVEAIQAYYKLLYTLQDESNFDNRRILGYLDKGPNRLDFEFKTAAENFKLINDRSVAIIIPYNDDAQQLLKALKNAPFPARTLRKLQVYTVNIYEREFEALQSLGVIQTVGDFYHALAESWMKTYYHPQTGLVLPESRGGEAVFFA
jgi:CRISPR-associated endonuclease/helicase Cas3